MQEVILVLNIGGTGLFTRLNRRKKKNKTKKNRRKPRFRTQKSSVCEEHQVCGSETERSWCRGEESRRCILVRILGPALSRIMHTSIAESSKVK